MSLSVKKYLNTQFKEQPSMIRVTIKGLCLGKALKKLPAVSYKGEIYRRRSKYKNIGSRRSLDIVVMSTIYSEN